MGKKKFHHKENLDEKSYVIMRKKTKPQFVYIIIWEQDGSKIDKNQLERNVLENQRKQNEK